MDFSGVETWAYTHSMLLRYLSTLLGRFFRSLRSLSSSVSDWDNTTAEVFMRECVCVCADNFRTRVISKTSTCEEQASHKHRWTRGNFKQGQYWVGLWDTPLDIVLIIVMRWPSPLWATLFHRQGSMATEQRNQDEQKQASDHAFMPFSLLWTVDAMWPDASSFWFDFPTAMDYNL